MHFYNPFILWITISMPGYLESTTKFKLQLIISQAIFKKWEVLSLIRSVLAYVAGLQKSRSMSQK